MWGRNEVGGNFAIEEVWCDKQKGEDQIIARADEVMPDVPACVAQETRGPGITAASSFG